MLFQISHNTCDNFRLFAWCQGQRCIWIRFSARSNSWNLKKVRWYSVDDWNIRQKRIYTIRRTKKAICGSVTPSTSYDVDTSYSDNARKITIEYGWGSRVLRMHGSELFYSAAWIKWLQMRGYCDSHQRNFLLTVIWRHSYPAAVLSMELMKLRIQ